MAWADRAEGRIVLGRMIPVAGVFFLRLDLVTNWNSGRVSLSNSGGSHVSGFEPP